MIVPWAYDMQVVDERLTAVENKVEQIMKLLKDISADLSNGDKDDKLREKTTIKTKRKSSTRQSNKEHQM